MVDAYGEVVFGGETGDAILDSYGEEILDSYGEPIIMVDEGESLVDSNGDYIYDFGYGTITEDEYEILDNAGVFVEKYKVTFDDGEVSYYYVYSDGSVYDEDGEEVSEDGEYSYIADIAYEEGAEIEDSLSQYTITVDGEVTTYYLDNYLQVTDEDGIVITNDGGYEYLEDLAEEEGGKLELNYGWNEDMEEEATIPYIKKYSITAEGETDYYYLYDDGSVYDNDGNELTEDEGYNYLVELAEEIDGVLEDAI